MLVFPSAFFSLIGNDGGIPVPEESRPVAKLRQETRLLKLPSSPSAFPAQVYHSRYLQPISALCRGLVYSSRASISWSIQNNIEKLTPGSLVWPSFWLRYSAFSFPPVWNVRVSFRDACFHRRPIATLLEVDRATKDINEHRGQSGWG